MSTLRLVKDANTRSAAAVLLCRPKRTDAAVIVGAYNDAYVSQKSVRELAQHWPGSQVPSCAHLVCMLSSVMCSLLVSVSFCNLQPFKASSGADEHVSITICEESLRRHWVIIQGIPLNPSMDHACVAPFGSHAHLLLREKSDAQEGCAKLGLRRGR